MPELSNDWALRTLRGIFDAAVASADPVAAVQRNLPEKPRGRCVVVGAGKASAAMAAAVDAAWPEVDVSGVVVTRYGHSVPAGRIRVIEASHPVPDAASEMAGQAIRNAVHGLSRDDLVIALISGGGSSLMVAPAGSLSLKDKQRVNEDLLRSGATISEINIVRKHLSEIKGGHLAKAASPARLVSLLISDVPGDDPSTVASGPTVSDASTVSDAKEIVSRFRIELPVAARLLLDSNRETPKQVQGDVVVIAAPTLALKAAATSAQLRGLNPIILGDALEGESRELAIAMAGIARSVRNNGMPIGSPAVLLSGGETTVSICRDVPGRGGRNTEFLLSFAIAMQGQANTWAIAGDSDGLDGTERAAGAFVSPDTLKRASELGLNARNYLEEHDSFSFFSELGDLVVTGPTRTNVNDIRAILVN
ncbi:MAG: glycerate kinase [Xanthobacteraceae bacterium]|nr:glycerate kinase [Xanthobacteraceae bacterium]